MTTGLRIPTPETVPSATRHTPFTSQPAPGASHQRVDDVLRRARGRLETTNGRARAGGRCERNAAWGTLAAADRDLARLISRRVPPGPVHWEIVERATYGDAFAELVLHFVGQGLAGDSAMRLYERLRTALGGAVEPLSIAVTSASDLRATGMTGSCARGLQDLAGRVLDGRLSFARLGQRTDDNAETELVRVHGVGPWAAQMLLLHYFRRPDILPAEDPGLREAARLALGLATRPSPRWLTSRASTWRPFRSYAAMALWSAADLHPYPKGA